ncbi:hypothetical protein [Photobacterium leiognathi]|uniref:hypothetical protein n=1 Tax=Photobacterium leiognathi TaxID=553611 RepID=UPI0027388F71|nr:hypothetical protein [Photobacterium leiognathi]
MNQSLLAPEILHHALSLGAIGSGLPYGWQFKTVSLQGDTINLTAERTPDGQRTVIMSWLKQYPQLLPYSQVSLESLSMTIPLLQTLQKWHDKIMPIEPSLSSVIDTQVALGWQMTDLTTDNGLVSITSRWTATKETALSELVSFHQMVSQLPVTITQLDITPSGTVGYFNIQIRFALMGQNKRFIMKKYMKWIVLCVVTLPAIGYLFYPQSSAPTPVPPVSQYQSIATSSLPEPPQSHPSIVIKLDSNAEKIIQKSMSWFKEN